MKKSAVIGTLALAGSAMLASTPAMAASEPGQMYIAPLGLFTRADADRNSHNGYGGALGFGSVVNPWLNIEGQAFGQRFDDNNHGRDWSEYGANINGLFFFSRNPVLSPFASVGLGVVRTEGDGVTNSVDPSLTAGLGVEHEFSHNGVALRLATNYRYLPYSSGGGDTMNFNEWQVEAGLVIPIGSPTEHPTQMAETKETAPPPPPAPVKTGPLDSDHDGVPDDQDKCPGTPAGAQVNYQGCEVLQTRQLNSLHFAFDSSKLTPEDDRYLDQEVDKINHTLIKYPQGNVEIAGYTDSIGTEAYNQGLSQRRTDSVRTYLVGHGVDPSRIISHGYGESDPVATNSTKSGRARNRRVEVRLVNGGTR